MFFFRYFLDLFRLWERSAWWFIMVPGKIPLIILSKECPSTNIITGRWFGTYFIFPNIWDNPSHWLLLFFKMVKTTNQLDMDWYKQDTENTHRDVYYIFYFFYIYIYTYYIYIHTHIIYIYTYYIMHIYILHNAYIYIYICILHIAYICIYMSGTLDGRTYVTKNVR